MPIAPDGSSPGPTWLQQQQANAAVGPALGSAAVGPATTLTFEGEDGEQVLIERVIARHSVWVQGAQGGATVEGVSTEPICTTPCTATVPNGGHTFVVEGYEFDVAARGGAETWRVSGNSTAGLWIGQILVYGGGAFALCGAVLLGIMGTGEDSMLTMNASFLGAGLGMLAIGIPVWVLSYGDAERVEGAPGYADAGGGTIAPGILAARTPSGDSVWGLSLSLTL